MRIYTTPSGDYDVVNKKYVDDNSGGTTLTLRATLVSGKYTYYITLSSATASTSNALSYTQLSSYLSGGASFTTVYGTPYLGGSTYGIVSLVGLDYDNDIPTAFLKIDSGENYGTDIYSQYLKLTASDTSTGLTANGSTAWVTASVSMTVAQLTAGTDTYCRPVTAKVIHDYIASLDATNVAY